MTPLERFWSKTRLAEGGCIEWTAGVGSDGYPLFKVGKTYRVARWIYEQLVGVIPAGLHIDHLCRNIRCVNIAHLEPVTPRQNTHRSTRVNRETCHSGRHPWTPENIYVKPQGSPKAGQRECLSCKRERAAA